MISNNLIVAAFTQKILKSLADLLKCVSNQKVICSMKI